MSRVEEIASDLFVLADLETIDSRLSWFPAGMAGVQPHNKFLLKAAGGFLLVDTGVAAHGPALLETVRRIIGAQNLTVILTRNELECNGNLALLLDELPRVRVLATNVLPALGLIHRSRKRPVETPPRVLQGDTLAAYGFETVRAVAPLIRTLGTTWLIDTASDTLFCSDFFGADQMANAEAPVIRDNLDSFVDAAIVRERLLAKFDWLARARTDLLEAQWRRFFDSYTPAHIAPALARVQSGADVTRHNVETYRTALFGAAGSS